MKYQTEKLTIFDLEIYRNYSLFGCLWEGKPLQFDHTQIESLRKFLKYQHEQGYELCGFNSNHYDAPVLHAMLESNGDPQVPFRTSYSIINEGMKPWDLPGEITTVDLMQILPGRLSLKKVGVILGHKKLQELPIPWDRDLTPEEMDVITKYNINDLEITQKLLDALQPEIDLRAEMSRGYGIDLRSRGEAAIAEVVLLREAGFKKYQMRELAQAKLAAHPEFKIKPPTWWQFFSDIRDYSDNLQTVVRVGNTLFDKTIRIINDRIPNATLAETIYLSDKFYSMGVGGLHSVDGAGAWVPAKHNLLVDIDVASYYPNIILTQGLAPSFWDGKFGPIYSSIVERRLKAKSEGDHTTAAVLKIVANGSFGKFGDKYSALYDQEMLAHVTVYGQLGLLVLIAMLTDNGHRVVSANTDGLSVMVNPTGNNYTKVVAEWEAMTGLTMEYTPYQGQYQLDVNNYLALTEDGKLKTKGRFLSKRNDLRHMPSALIVARAVGHHIDQSKTVIDTIAGETDIHMFLFCASVTGQWKVTWGDRKLSKIVRFYKSKRKDLPPIIRTPVSDEVKGNEGQIPDSENCVPLENLPDTIPDDLDRDWYIERAYELINRITEPKLTGMNAEAQRLTDMGLQPCVVDAGSRSRAGVTWGTTDFNSIAPHQTLAVRTGNGVIAVTRGGMLDSIGKTDKDYPSRSRAKIEKDAGCEYVYGASVPVPPWGIDQVDPVKDYDTFFTPSELKKVRG